MNVALRKVRFTYHDYLHLPEDKRYEIIDGDLHMTPAPLMKHQKVSGHLYRILHEWADKESRGEVFYAPVDVILSDEDVLQPDLLFISQERLGILTEKNVQGAPDLVIEILSPHSQEWDRSIKRKLYEKYGVREYWMVDLEAQSIEVLPLTDEGFKTLRVYTKGTHLKSPLLENLSFSVEEIF